MRDWRSQSHVRWYCKYHIVFVQKYHAKVRVAACARERPEKLCRYVARPPIPQSFEPSSSTLALLPILLQ